MAGEFFPRREGEFRMWAAHLVADVVQAPQAYGIPPDVAVHFGDLYQQFAQAYDQAADPQTATRAARAQKRHAKSAFITLLRSINARIKSMPTVSDQQRMNLGINPRRAGGRQTRLPAPETPPVVSVEAVRGRTVHVQLGAKEQEARGRLRGAKGANVYVFVGDHPPTSVHEWQWVGDTVRTRFAFDFPVDVPPGAKIWITAQWKTVRGLTGPPAGAVPFHLQGGGVQKTRRGIQAA